jgi:hypothetical protein
VQCMGFLEYAKEEAVWITPQLLIIVSAMKRMAKKCQWSFDDPTKRVCFSSSFTQRMRNNELSNSSDSLLCHSYCTANMRLWGSPQSCRAQPLRFSKHLCPLSLSSRFIYYICFIRKTKAYFKNYIPFLCVFYSVIVSLTACATRPEGLSFTNITNNC